ncbi:Tol biopolymer transport system component [Lysinibacillus composti]|uniref:DUF5050 domain-containing protein n=1 Tax=Lysinibacillus composti TaxID=720633 RepID=A0A3N9UAY3_9BACI|nr:hypothetical protein [Lysinibacillus composti]MBM7609733.1 Tol biopolymer transport system component [Lysinibacillus composti]RQW73654.1 hypothetical protein EBB45_15500 [Lysinibacillus composti]
MKNKKLLWGLMSVTFLLFVGSIVFSLLRDDDPYRYYTGIGSSFDLSPDEEQYLFPYYVDGNESIYRSNADGTNVTKLVESETARLHSPRYSNDGAKILYLAENPEHLNTLFVANEDGSEQKLLTPDKTHVSEAVFSKTGDKIFFVGTPAEDYKKVEGETTEGFDLFSVDLDSGKIDQLTNRDYFTMNDLSISHDGKELYYSLFEVNRENVTAYSIADGIEQEAPGSNWLPEDSYAYRYSSDGSKMAYTSISEESLDSSLFKYELFLLDLENGESKRLTNLGSSVVSPMFLRTQNSIAFLENKNWPQVPEKHTLKVLDLGTEKIKSIEMEMTPSNSNHWVMKTLDLFANGYTVAALYVILLGLLSTYLFFFHSTRKRFIPAIISFTLAVLVFISSFIVAMAVDPWYGIGVGILAAALLGCTLIIFAYAYALKFFFKGNNTSIEMNEEAE